MWMSGVIFLSMLAALGVALLTLEIFRHVSAKKGSFVCICFKEELLGEERPDVVIICRSDAEQEEIIRRIGENDERKIYLKYL